MTSGEHGGRKLQVQTTFIRVPPRAAGTRHSELIPHHWFCLCAWWSVGCCGAGLTRSFAADNHRPRPSVWFPAREGKVHFRKEANHPTSGWQSSDMKCLSCLRLLQKPEKTNKALHLNLQVLEAMLLSLSVHLLSKQRFNSRLQLFIFLFSQKNSVFRQEMWIIDLSVRWVWEAACWLSLQRAEMICERKD